MCFVRKGLDWVFTRHELTWLDDIMPETHKKEKEENKKKLMEEQDHGVPEKKLSVSLSPSNSNSGLECLVLQFLLNPLKNTNLPLNYLNLTLAHSI